MPEEFYDAEDDTYEGPELDVDVCQNCGGYFAWTARLREAWQKHWNPLPTEKQPQRCHRCIVDECWVEDRDEN